VGASSVQLQIAAPQLEWAPKCHIHHPQVSLYSWLGASCCTIASELTEILRAALPAILVRLGCQAAVLQFKPTHTHRRVHSLVLV
jgi:hypothetical protein